MRALSGGNGRGFCSDHSVRRWKRGYHVQVRRMRRPADTHKQPNLVSLSPPSFQGATRRPVAASIAVAESIMLPKGNNMRSVRSPRLGTGAIGNLGVRKEATALLAARAPSRAPAGYDNRHRGDIASTGREPPIVDETAKSQGRIVRRLQASASSVDRRAGRSQARPHTCSAG
jgi:hypothetical protein